MSRRRVFVTGADTLIGSRILDQLLVYDVSVRAVVGSHGQVNILRQQYPPTSYPWLEIAIVPTRDLSLPNAFDDALRDHPEPFDTIIHAVADHSGDADCLTQFIALQSEYLLNLLRSVHSVTSRVHRVVLTTSLSPFARWLVEPDPGPYSPYNSAPQRAAEVDPEYILATSQASENLVYNRIWEWIRQTHARFELVYVTAPSVYGPTLRPLENSSDLQEANRRIWNICSNDARERMTSPPYGIDYYTDVRVSFACYFASFRIWRSYAVLGSCLGNRSSRLRCAGRKQTLHHLCRLDAAWSHHR